MWADLGESARVIYVLENQRQTKGELQCKEMGVIEQDG